MILYIFSTANKLIITITRRNFGFLHNLILIWIKKKDHDQNSISIKIFLTGYVHCHISGHCLSCLSSFRQSGSLSDTEITRKCPAASL